MLFIYYILHIKLNKNFIKFYNLYMKKILLLKNEI